MNMPLTVGGGIRSVGLLLTLSLYIELYGLIVPDDASVLLSAGADKVSVNTAAVQNPQLISDIAQRFGSQCTVLAIDAVRSSATTWEVVVKSGKEKTVGLKS